MRRLYLVPIIHAPPDMGTVAGALSRQASQRVGQRQWTRHVETVSRFWSSLIQFFDVLDVKGFKVYQDGMVASGPQGMKIVETGERSGSANYRLISSLVKRGAVLMKTEDVSLVKEEYDLISKATEAGSRVEREESARQYGLTRDKLLRERDTHIARTIADSLYDGETGILFIGAYHDILSRLPADVNVVQVKDTSKVRQYHMAMTNEKASASLLNKLADYLVSPVEASG